MLGSVGASNFQRAGSGSLSIAFQGCYYVNLASSGTVTMFNSFVRYDCACVDALAHNQDFSSAQPCVCQSTDNCVVLASTLTLSTDCQLTEEPGCSCNLLQPIELHFDLPAVSM